jgi:hypothetical protein
MCCLRRSYITRSPRSLVVGLASVGVSVHYFHQEPGEAMPPLSHGLPRLLVWTIAIAWPVEIWYGRTGIVYLWDWGYLGWHLAAVFGVEMTLVVVFGLGAVLLEAVLRWGLYGNPVELHGQHAPLVDKSCLRRPLVLVGLVLVGIFAALAVAGAFIPVPPFPPLTSNIVEYSLRSLYTFLLLTVTNSLLTTIIGGALGLAGYFALRVNQSWAVGYIGSFPLSLFVVTMMLQPPVPFIWYLSMALLLSVGAIRRLSNTNLGKGSMALRNWLRSLIPLFIHYTLVCGLLVLVVGITSGEPYGLYYYSRLNLGQLVYELRNFRFAYPAILTLPGVLAGLFVVAFDLLWCGLRQTSWALKVTPA